MCPKPYHGDKIVAILWKQDPSTVPRPGARQGAKKLIKGGPLIDLGALQEMLRNGDLDLGKDEHCWVGTNNCYAALAKLEWTTGDQVSKLILLLRPGRLPKGDFVNSQWCSDSEGALSPCDAYKVRIDEQNWKRDVRAPLYYVKFSVDDTGQLHLVLISCHLDKPY